MKGNHTFFRSTACPRHYSISLSDSASISANKQLTTMGLLVRESLPKAIHVFDHFHVVRLFNDRLADFRRQPQCEADGSLGNTVLKGTRWLILKNPENLNLPESIGSHVAHPLGIRIDVAPTTGYETR